MKIDLKVRSQVNAKQSRIASTLDKKFVSAVDPNLQPRRSAQSSSIQVNPVNDKQFDVIVSDKDEMEDFYLVEDGSDGETHTLTDPINKPDQNLCMPTANTAQRRVTFAESNLSISDTRGSITNTPQHRKQAQNQWNTAIQPRMINEQNLQNRVQQSNLKR